MWIPGSFVFWCCRIHEKWKSGAAKLHTDTADYHKIVDSIKLVSPPLKNTSSPDSVGFKMWRGGGFSVLKGYYWALLPAAPVLWLLMEAGCDRLQCIEPSEPSFMLKNGERLAVKSIHKLPAGSTVKAVDVTGRLTNGRRPSRSPLTQQAEGKQRSVQLPHPSPSPIRQTARCVYLRTADQRLLNITKAKSIIHKRDKRLPLPIFEETFPVRRRSTSLFWPSAAFIKASVLLRPLLRERRISDMRSSRKWSHTAGSIHPSTLMRS